MRSGLAVTVMMATLLSCSGAPEPVVQDAGSLETPYVCSPETCAGCCLANRCRMENTELACGTGGVACASCAQGELCLLPEGRCGAGAVHPAGQTQQTPTPGKEQHKNCRWLPDGQYVCS